jgi:hypothetical protein
VIDRSDESRYLAASRNRDNGPFTPTGKTLPVDRNLSTPTTPVDAFMSSLSSSRSVSTRPPSSLNTDDTRLLEQVFESLGKVCTELQELTMAASTGTNGTTAINANGSAGTTPTADPKYIRTLRRRLDAARRVLDGQLDSDA